MIEDIERRLPGWEVRRENASASSQQANVGNPIWVDEPGLLRLTRIVDGSDYCLRFADQIAVELRFARRLIIEKTLSDDIPPSTCDHFLCDQVLPRILGHNGELVLHAAAVRVGDGAVVFVGPSGSGKSTLAASFDREGYRLLGDDTIIVSWREGMPHAQAVYPSLRLFPDSIDALLSEDVATASVAHYTPKRRIAVPLTTESEAESFPIRTMFMIGGTAPSTGVQVKSKSKADCCMALIENSFVLDPSDTSRAPGRLQKAGRLAREVPAFDLSYPRTYPGLADVRSAILETLPRSASATRGR